MVKFIRFHSIKYIKFSPCGSLQTVHSIHCFSTTGPPEQRMLRYVFIPPMDCDTDRVQHDTLSKFNSNAYSFRYKFRYKFVPINSLNYSYNNETEQIRKRTTKSFKSQSIVNLGRWNRQRNLLLRLKFPTNFHRGRIYSRVTTRRMYMELG